MYLIFVNLSTLPARVSRVLIESPVAVVNEHQPEVLMKELRLNSVGIERKEETIQEIASLNNKRGADIPNVIF